ncbi:MAG: response regulator [Alphaproteobacteria bacterium]
MIAKPPYLLSAKMMSEVAAADGGAALSLPEQNFMMLDIHALNNFLAAIGRYAECLSVDLAARQLETTLPESILKTLEQIETTLLQPVDTPVAANAIKQNPIIDAQILLIDDQDDIRLSTGMMLKQCGLRVLDFGSVEAAMAGADMTQIDLVISDLKMPNGWSGLEFARFVAEKMGRAAPPVLIMSGQNPREIKASQDLPPSVKGIYKKPLSRSALLAAIAEALEIT